MSDSPPGFNASIVAAAATSVGRIRTTNEDRFLIDVENGWFAIADGVGGLPFGERASECAIRQLGREIGHPDSGAKSLRDTVAACHQAVRQMGAFLSPRHGVGTTFTLLRCTKERNALLAHIGDSIALLHPARSHPIVALSTSHTVEVPPVAVAGDSSRTFQPPPRLARYLGQPTPPDCDILPLKLNGGDRIILCSDGVTHSLDHSEIEALSIAQPTAAAFAKALVHIADIRGGYDNATAVIIDIKDTA